MKLLFTENKSTEAVNGRAVLPFVGKKAGFSASFGQEPLAIPSVGSRNLRQQQSTLIFFADQKAMLSYFNLVDVFNREHERKNGDLEFHAWQLAGHERHEPRITYCCRDGAFGGRSIQCCCRMKISDATPKLAAFMDRDEDSVSLR